MTPNLLWHQAKSSAIVSILAIVPSIALILLLPVILRGTKWQKTAAVLLALPASYLAYQGWEIFFFDHVLGH